jgi:hypothetical protein
MQNAYNQANLQNQVAQTQGNLAGQEQSLGLTGAGAMTKAGAEQQAYNQSIIDAPLKTAANSAALLKGFTVPTTTTETYKGPLAGTYGPSQMSQLVGLGSLIGSGLADTTTVTIDPITKQPVTKTTPGWMSSGYDWIKGKFSNPTESTGSTDYGSAPPSSYSDPNQMGYDPSAP